MKQTISSSVLKPSKGKAEGVWCLLGGDWQESLPPNATCDPVPQLMIRLPHTSGEPELISSEELLYQARFRKTAFVPWRLAVERSTWLTDHKPSSHCSQSQTPHTTCAGLGIFIYRLSRSRWQTETEAETILREIRYSKQH